MVDREKRRQVMSGFGPIVEVASTVGVGGVLVFAAWQLSRTLFLLAFVLVMCRVQGRKTGRYPTLTEATRNLRQLLGK